MLTKISLDLRKFARNQPCTVMLDGCDGGGETTVLAHFRGFGSGGMGLKPHDFIGAHACAHCHDLLDGRISSHLSPESLDIAHMSAIIRTLQRVGRECK